MIPYSIINRFEQWHSSPSWVVCNSQKQPEYRGSRDLLRWRRDPNSQSFMQFSELQKWESQHEGFGIFLGRQNNLASFDLDHVLDKPNGDPVNPDVLKFLNELNTFTELSSSGTGLHPIVCTDVDVDVPEFGFKSNFCDGKYYCNRFLKLTGNIYRDFDAPIKRLTQQELTDIQKRIGIIEQEHTPPPRIASQIKTNGQSKVNDGSWDEILTNAGIWHIKASMYAGKIRKYSDGSSKFIVEAYKIECPNRAAHKTDRPGDPSAHLAILSKTVDGMSSVRCHHTACTPEKRPNLLLKLWDNIRSTKIQRRKNFMKDMGLTV